MPQRSGKVLRCAVYTRKSTEHGLELEFNSLDAQREACEAYIKSQASEGWRLLPARYDDPAYSGGNLERPALKRLLKDLEGGQVDVVVVYKIDRLTRSLTDFAKLVEIFEAKNVSFVAITQQFNTTTSMGRLTLNVLLSFAQFERELASERVRDKVAASRRKGKWTGGSVPLGYDSKDKRLVVNPVEAKTVRMIFERYVALGSFQKLTAELDAKGIVTKKRLVAGKAIGGIPFTYGPLAYLLRNPIYVGKISHNGSSFPGEHEPIIHRDIFDQVQNLIESHRVDRYKRRNDSGALLKGLIFDDRGNRMSPSFSVKDGVRYPYYVSAAHLRGRKSQAGSVSRVSAMDIEAIILKALTAKSADLDHSAALAMSDFVEQHVARIVVGPEQVTITLKGNNENDDSAVDKISWSPRKGRESGSIDETRAANSRAPDPRLVQAIVRAHAWVKLLAEGTYESIDSLARAINLHPKVVRKAIRLAFLAPTFTQAFLLGEHQGIKLGDLDQRVAFRWDEQKQLDTSTRTPSTRP